MKIARRVVNDRRYSILETPYLTKFEIPAALEAFCSYSYEEGVWCWSTAQHLPAFAHFNGNKRSALSTCFFKTLPEAGDLCVVRQTPKSPLGLCYFYPCLSNAQITSGFVLFLPLSFFFFALGEYTLIHSLPSPPEGGLDFGTNNWRGAI